MEIMFSDEVIKEIARELCSIDPQSFIALVGSYATQKATSRSDLDLLVISDRCDIQKKVEGMISTKFSQVTSRLDCKIITTDQFRTFKDSQYLLLFFMLQDAQFLSEKTFHLPFNIAKFAKEFEILLENITRLDHHLNNQVSPRSIMYLLFCYSKTLNYVEQYISPHHYCSLKEIWKSHLAFLGQGYERTKKNFVSTSLEMSYSLKPVKKGSFGRLRDCYQLLTIYKETVANKFGDWYEKQTR